MDSIHSKRHKKEKAAGPDIIYNEYLKYRGIALENNPFKVFTKLITERIRLTLEEHLPESQFGFRRGRSTLLWNYC